MAPTSRGDVAPLDLELNRAQKLEQQGNRTEAELLYRQILARQPENGGALHLLGLLCFKGGRAVEGLDLVRRSVKAQPNNADFRSNHAIILSASGLIHEAEGAIRKAIDLRPDHAPFHNNLGVTCETSGHYDQAIEAFHAAITFAPRNAQFHVHLGNALRKAGKLDEAEITYRQALGIQSDYSQAWQNLASVLQEKLRHDQAFEAFEKAIALAPQDAALHSSFLYAVHYNPLLSPQEIFDLHLRWARQYESVLQMAPHVFANDRSVDRRLRIGYLSPDFRRHSVATFFQPLLSHHKRKQFEIFCYSATDKPDDLTTKLGSLSNHWRNISKLRDQQAADQIRQDQIDILVDLTGHMAGNRLLIFARKPAPIQITYVGHPNTTGMASMDYRLTDPRLEPPEVGSDALHTEKLIRLPRIFGCYQAPDDEFVTNLPPAQSNGYITFGCLNNPAKITEPAIRLWCQILHQVPGSRLLLLGEPGVKGIDDLIAACGIASHRVERIGRLKRREYFEAFNRLDIALDCFPYNGQTTSCDGFWMGVPLVTLVGNSYVSRMGHCLLTNVGMPDLIAQTPQQYVQIATALAGDLDQLAEIRRTLRNRLKRSPIMDGAALAKDIEAVYRQVWSDYCHAAEHSPILLQSAHAGDKLTSAAGQDRPSSQPLDTEIDQSFQLAKTEFEASRLPQAEIHCRHVLQIDPDLPSALHMLGLILQAGNRVLEAEELFRRCVELAPEVAEHRNNWGALLGRLGRFDESSRELKKVVEFFPTFAPGHRNLGITLIRQGQVDVALGCLRHAVELAPEDASAHTNLGMALMFQGNFAEGLPGMEWRLRTQSYWWQGLPKPLWQGQDLTGKTILLHAEQGLGDTVQFVRYARLIQQAGAKVLLMVQPPLCRLMESIQGIQAILALGDELVPDFDVHAPLMSLPKLLGTTIDSVPDQVPYLHADPERIAYWKEYLDKLGPGMGPGINVGISWQGNASFYSDRHRSIPLACFERLAKLPGVRLISLQKGFGSEQLADFAAGDVVVNPRLDHQADTVLDTPAMIANLDLVIASDTAIAHLAGALGVPVWVALGAAPDWRWMAERKDSPWYPTMRLFRQMRLGDWQEVFEEMANGLADLVAARENMAQAAPTICVTPGELLDRLSLLRVHAIKITDKLRRMQVAQEIAELEHVVAQTLPASPMIPTLLNSLSSMHDQIAQARQELYDLKANDDFGSTFVDASRQLLDLENRQRHLIKQVNKLLGSKRIGTAIDALPVCSPLSAQLPPEKIPTVDDGVAALNAHRPESAFRMALAILDKEPQNARAAHLAGLAAYERGDVIEAMQWLTRSVAMDPRIPAFHNNLGEALRKSDRLEEALLSYQEALRLKEDYSDAHFNMGIAHRYLGQIDKALACNLRAVTLSPHDPEIHLNLSITHLLKGDLANGFAEYEWRWKAASFKTPKRRFNQPQWKGEDLVGRKILVHAEQGFGDAIQFCRYIALLANEGATVTLEVQPEVKTLLQYLPARVIARGEALGAYDYHCPMLSLPCGFYTNLETVPSNVPYLKPDPERVAYWQDRLAEKNRVGKKVGLVWAGRPTHQNDHNRSIFLEQLLPLGRIEGLRLISLQQGGAAGQAKRFTGGESGQMHIEQYGPFTDFADTAALLQNLDLLISVDTAVAHMAGALARPIWMLNPLVCDWRWIFGRDDSPWYPTMRIFRQAKSGHWEDVIEHLANALNEFAS